MAQLAFSHPFTQISNCLSSARQIVDNNKAFHPGAVNHQVHKVRRTGYRLGSVVGRDSAAQHNPRSHVDVIEGGFENLTTNVIEEYVDLVWAQLANTLINVI